MVVTPDESPPGAAVTVADDVETTVKFCGAVIPMREMRSPLAS